MKRILLFTTFLFFINFFFISTRIFAEDINNGPMTLEVPQAFEVEGVSNDPAILKINVPDTWTMSMNKSNDFLFKHLKSPAKIELTFVNTATYFKDEASKIAILNSSVNGAESSLKKSAQQFNSQYNKVCDVENINNNKIHYCIFTIKTPNETEYFKILYPTSNKNIFLIYIHFKDGAPFQDAEQLINNIVLAITGSY
ncbi:MAG: hypothetical protein AB1782_02950 [Cyanobacteriota bacterium]